MVVVGVEGRGGLYVDQLVLRCASVGLAGAVGNDSVDVGSTIVTTTMAGGTGGSAFTPYTCPNPQIVNRITGKTGDSVDNLMLSCATPAVVSND